jgi:hypothetical protein
LKFNVSTPLAKAVNIKSLIAAVILNLTLLQSSNAALTSVGTGTIAGQSYNLIYSENSPYGGVVYLDYTKALNTWESQTAWLGSLTISVKDGYTINWGGDWRLPQTVSDYPAAIASGEPDYWYSGKYAIGFNNTTTSEMGFLYYTELGNKGFVGTDGLPQSNSGLKSTGLFENLKSGIYWSATERFDFPQASQSFYVYQTIAGNQFSDTIDQQHLMMALRSAIVSPVPEPATGTLMLAGLAAGFLHRRRMHARG